MVSVWSSIAKKTCKELSDKGVELQFTQSNEKDTYVKAKAGPSRMNWGFAISNSSDRLWVELEILPRTRQGQSAPQKEVYQQIKNKSKEIETKFGHNITWDEEDRFGVAMKVDRSVFRIKSYIDSFKGSVASCEKECVDRTVSFILAIRSY